MVIGRRQFGLLVAAALLPIATGTAEDGDAQRIAALLREQFAKPGASLRVAPVVVAGAYAIADWEQGDLGGRALLRRSASGWSVMLCAGDQIRSADALARAGVPAADAVRLAQDLMVAERAVSAETLARMARFDGVVMMDGSGAHPPGRAPAAHHH